MFKRIMIALLWRVFNFKNFCFRNYMKKHKRYYNEFMAYNATLVGVTGKKLEKYYNLRLMEIDREVVKNKVTKIIEMGTGRTTFFFANYQGVSVTCYEQDKEWEDIVTKGLKAASTTPPQIVVSEVSPYRTGGRFDGVVPEECDLLYIDGPYIYNNGKTFDTFTGKASYHDFETFFANGMFPKVIMIEGRTDTADAILQCSAAQKYNFIPEFQYAIQRGNVIGALKLSRHSIFTLKN